LNTEDSDDSQSKSIQILLRQRSESSNSVYLEELTGFWPKHKKKIIVALVLAVLMTSAIVIGIN